MLNNEFIHEEHNRALPTPQGSLQALNDFDLRNVTGKSLFDITQRTGANGNQFLRFLFNSKVDTNLNIEQLRLGETNNEDLYLEKVSLSGGSGPDSWAEITRPFLELALSSFDESAQKKLIGLRVGAEKIDGVLGIGTQDASASNPFSDCALIGGDECSDTGIKAFNGYLRTANADAAVTIGEIKLQDYLTARAAGNNFDFGDGVNVNLTQYRYPNRFSANPVTEVDHRINNNFYSRRLSASESISCGWFCNTPAPETHGRGGQQDGTLQGAGELTVILTVDGSVDYGATLRDNIPSIEADVVVPSQILHTISGSTDSINIDVPEANYHDLIFAPTNQWGNACAGQSGPTCVDNTAGLIYHTGQACVNPTTGGGIGPNCSSWGQPAYIDNFLANIVRSTALSSEISGISFTAEVNQELRFIHRIETGQSGGNQDGIYLSVQSETIRWPDSIEEAYQGYWLEVQPIVELGANNDLGLLPGSVIIDESGYRQLEVAIERGLLGIHPNLAQALTGGLDIGSIDLDFILTQELESLPLGQAQSPPVNCYGGIDCF